jgi:hypothetical protein
MKLYRFRTVRLSIISFSLYVQKWYMSYSFADSRIRMESWSCSNTVCKIVWRIPLLCVQWKTPDDGQRNCPKHVDFQCKNKFEKFVNLVGFIIRIHHDARSHERQICLEILWFLNWWSPNSIYFWSTASQYHFITNVELWQDLLYCRTEVGEGVSITYWWLDWQITFHA